MVYKPHTAKPLLLHYRSLLQHLEEDKTGVEVGA